MDGRTRRLWLRGGQTGAYNEWAKRCQHFVQDDDVVLVVLVIAVVVVVAAVHCWLSLFHIALLIVVAFVVVVLLFMKCQDICTSPSSGAHC